MTRTALTHLLSSPWHTRIELLLSLPPSVFQIRSDSVLLFRAICRLLLQLAGKQSLEYAHRLSYLIYEFERNRKQPYPVAHLYRGISQIGLKHTATGVRNVLTGLGNPSRDAKPPLDSLYLTDRCLGYWGLVSAAILNRDLRLALNFAKAWLRIAEEGALEAELFRANGVLLLLHLLLGDEKGCSPAIPPFPSRLPEEWNGVVSFLQEWAEALLQQGDISLRPLSEPEPLPLLLGLDWHGLGPATQEAYSQDFRALCALRRRFCNPLAGESDVPVEELLAYASRLARWELLKPLRKVELLLKRKSPEQFYAFLMARILGRRAAEQITYETPADSLVSTLDDALILMMDVRGYSTLGERLSAEAVFEILSPLYKIMNEEMEEADGMILEFVGDALIVVFNTFKNRRTDIVTILRHTVRALKRILMLNALNRLSARICGTCPFVEPPEIRIGVGVNKGPVAIGYLGGLSRCHLAVLGNTVNAAARIESLTKELPGSVLVSGACFDGGEPDLWADPLRVSFTFRDLGRHPMRNISGVVHLFGVSPLLRTWIDFVPMGFVAEPEESVVYLDTGNSFEPGIIDHHHCGLEAKSACELLITRPDLLLGHTHGMDASQIEFRLHQIPDLDCAATLYAAYELMDGRPRENLLRKLAAYVSLIDQGILPQPEKIADSLYGISLAHQSMVSRKCGREVTDILLLEAGLRVIDAAFYLMEKNPYGAELSYIFQFEPGWFAEERRFLEQDRTRYGEDLKLRSLTYEANIGGRPQPLIGLWLDHPESILFKFWARNDPRAPGGKGYSFLAVDWSEPSNATKPAKHRFVISVDPESQSQLKGLGELLEGFESKKRKELGQERPPEPARPGADNSDPWYFGQGHGFTIVDSPHAGTVLTAEEVRRNHAEWKP